VYRAELSYRTCVCVCSKELIVYQLLLYIAIIVYHIIVLAFIELDMETMLYRHGIHHLLSNRIVLYYRIVYAISIVYSTT